MVGEMSLLSVISRMDGLDGHSAHELYNVDFAFHALGFRQALPSIMFMFFGVVGFTPELCLRKHLTAHAWRHHVHSRPASASVD